MAEIVLFGIQDTAELAHYYLTNDSEHEVAAFCVHRKYLPENPVFKGLPVVTFEEVEQYYPPRKYQFFAPLTGQKMNQLRKAIYEEAGRKGYSFINYISSHATVLTEDIGDNCFILEDNTIQPFVTIGSNVVLWSGNHIGHHSRVGDHSFITSHVVISGHCRLDNSCFIGVNASLRDGIQLAEGTFVAMQSCLTTDTAPWGAYKGNPARKLKISSQDVPLYHEMA